MNEPYNYTPPAPPEKPRYTYRLADRIAALAAWILGYLFCVVTPLSEHLWGAFAFMLLMFIGAFLYFRLTDRVTHIRPLAWVVAAVSMILSVGFLTTTNGFLRTLVFLFDCAAWFYTIYLLGNNTDELFPGQTFIKDLCRSVFVMPFSAKGHLFGALLGNKREEGKSKLGGHILWALLGLLIALCPTLIVGVLLSYDEGFTSIIEGIFENLLSFDTLGEQIGNLLLGLIIGLLLFGALLACRDRRGRRENRIDNDDLPAEEQSLSCHFLPVTMICAALTPILVLYVIFFISQWDYYISALTGVRPETLTFSEYARSGFFQLCAVAGINAGMGLIACALVKHNPPNESRPHRDPVPLALRFYMVVLSVFTLILIATALAKMILYVDSYGLTHKRVLASWLMVVLALCFVAVIIRQFIRKLNLTGTVVTIFVVCFMVLCLCNLDGIIARYNVDAALDGNLLAIGGNILEDTDASGVLPALEYLEQTEGSTDEAVMAAREEVKSYLNEQAHRLGHMEIGEKNIPCIIAKKALSNHGYDTQN